jgi:prepilin-type processing-associated H-X9-DG protein
LVELLVALGAIGVLLGLFATAVQQVRTAAARVEDQNNLRQLALAVRGYTDTQNGTLPPALTRELGRDRWWFGEARLGSDRWFFRQFTPDPPEVDTSRGHLSPYLEGRFPHDPVVSAGQLHARYRGATGGYGYNYRYLAPTTFMLPAWEPVWSPVALSQVRNQGQTVLFTDAAGTSVVPSSGAEVVIEVGVAEPPSGQYPNVHFRHAGGVANVAFVDGHVEARSCRTRNPAPAEEPQSLTALRDWHGIYDLGVNDQLWDRD